jgi:hypothetical protein
MFIDLIALSLSGSIVPSDARLRQATEALGGPHPYAEFNQIGRYGCIAVPMLVDELRVVKAGRYFPPQQGFAVSHAMWVFAALRRVTGRDFYGRATPRQLQSFSDQGRYFLQQFAPAGRVKPFGIWLSHGVAYAAPESAQRKINSAWRRFAASGACRKQHPRSDPSEYLTGDIRN